MDLGSIIKTYLIIFCVILVVGIGVYIAMSYSIYKVLKNLEYNKAWMGWIPVVQYSALVMATDLDYSNKINILGVSINRKIVQFFPLLYLLGIIPVIGGLLSSAISIIIIGSICRDLYCLVEDKTPSDVCILAYFSGIQPIILIAKCYQYIYSWKKAGMLV